MSTKDLLSLKISRDEEKSLVNIDGIVPKQNIEDVRAKVLERLSKEKKIDGFRDGNAPIDVVEKEIGSLDVWQHSAHEVIMEKFPEFIAEENLVPLGQPNLQFTSIPDKGDVAFNMNFYVMPTVELPELNTLKDAIGIPEKAEEATDEEVDQAVVDVRRGLYKRANPEKEFPQDVNELPELTDECVQEISQQYKGIDDFLKGIRESITKEKGIKARSQHRQKILDELAKNTNISIPENVVEEEAQRGRSEIETQAKSMGTTIEEFLKEQKTTEDEFMNKLREDAKMRSKIQLILNHISAKENIYANPEDVKKEVERFKGKEHGMSDDQLHVYLSSILANESVIQFLEEKFSGISVNDSSDNTCDAGLDNKGEQGVESE